MQGGEEVTSHITELWPRLEKASNSTSRFVRHHDSIFRASRGIKIASVSLRRQVEPSPAKAHRHLPVIHGVGALGLHSAGSAGQGHWPAWARPQSRLRRPEQCPLVRSLERHFQVII